MLWEDLFADRFSASISDSKGVCILPVGCLEKHGDHLPLGTDMFIGRAVSAKAAEMETAVVFPYYFFGQIAEARHVPGTIAASHRLLMDTILEMCDEIHRNGFKKIILYSCHGGNWHFLPFFAQQMPSLDRSYNVYVYSVMNMKEEQTKTICKLAGTGDLGRHAGIAETSLIMYIRPDLVRMETVDTSQSKSLERLAQLQEKGVNTGFNWYSEYPWHFAGDPTGASAELGKTIFDMSCENLIEVIRAVKADDISEKLIREFALAGRNPQ